MARRLFALFNKKDPTNDEAESERLNTRPSNTDNAESLTQNITRGIEQICQNVSQVESLIKQTGVSSPDANEHRHRMLLQVISYTNQVAKDTSKDLQELFQQPLPNNSNEQFKRENLAAQLYSVLENLKRVEKSVAEKERASICEDDWVVITSTQDMPKVHGSPATFQRYADENAKFDEIKEKQEEFTNTESPFHQTARVLQMENDVDLNLIKERETAIHQLERSVMDVNQIFKDLACLVHEQGEVLDGVEANVEHAEMHVQEGVKQLSKARDYESTARRKRLCCLIGGFLSILTIVGIVLTIVVNRLFIIMPITSFLGIIVTTVCLCKKVLFQCKFKSSDGTDIKLKAKGTHEGISVDFKAKMKA